MDARLAGTWLTPGVELRFGFDDAHAVTGMPLRDWVKTLPEAVWNNDTKAWTVLDFGGRAVAAILAKAGFRSVLGPDGHAADVDSHAAPLAVGEPGERMMTVAIYPRLGGLAYLRGKVPATAVWRRSDRAWLTSPFVVTTGGAPVGWCAVPEPVLAWVAANPEQTHDMTPPLDYDRTVVGLMGTPTYVLGCVTPATASALAATGIESVSDLLHTMPRRYIDMTGTTVAGMQPGADFSIVGTVTNLDVNASRTKAVIVDDNGTKIWVTWFRVRGLRSRIPDGTRVVLGGAKLTTFTSQRGFTGLSMTNPTVEPVVATSSRYIGVYPASGTAGLTTWAVFDAVKEAAHRVTDLVDPVPPEFLAKRWLPSLADAFRMVHDPATEEEKKAGRDRLAYQELLRLQLVIRRDRAVNAAQPGCAHTPTGALTEPFLAGRGYDLTGAQKRVVAEIRDDMTTSRPMSRLLQGDVGAGKTDVSVLALLMAVESGRQGALMAPNETLTNQHFEDIRDAVASLSKPDGSPVTVALATNKVTGKARKAMFAGLADGSIDIVVGTQALIDAKVAFHDLTMVVVDEQHRFGVEQRAALRSKGSVMPDVLYASATPVPRSAAMTVFGDLDLSVLDEMPPGRQPVATVVVAAGEVDPSRPGDDPWAAIRSAVSQGRQAFVVTPLATSATRESAAAHVLAESLSLGALSGLRVGTITGKDDAKERRATMSAFAAGDLDVLVATTVIEVGVNVPNATVMVITGGERFGLAQLHQLRGRVGRGGHPGRCLIVADPKTSLAQQRLDALASTTDGFALAELDYQLRGGGDVASGSQSGRSRTLRIASITADTEILRNAIEDAIALTEHDPDLDAHPALRAEVDAFLDEDQADFLRSA